MRQNRRILLALLFYSGLHGLSWWILGQSNGNEAWATPFNWFFGIAFLPLNLMTFAILQAVWGTTDIFQARIVVGIVADFAVASAVSAALLGGVVVLVRRAVQANVAGVAKRHHARGG